MKDFEDIKTVRRVFIALSCIAYLLLVSPVKAQSSESISEVFSTMPDSIFPTLTKNNRLDMIDFVYAKMKAEVTNRLEGDSELLHLSEDSLTMHMSPALTVTMYLLNTEQEYDSLHQVICIERHYVLVSDSTQETTRTFYSLKWNALKALSPKDEKRLRPLPPSTILKRDDEVFVKELS